MAKFADGRNGPIRSTQHIGHIRTYGYGPATRVTSAATALEFWFALDAYQSRMCEGSPVDGTDGGGWGLTTIADMDAIEGGGRRRR